MVTKLFFHRFESPNDIFNTHIWPTGTKNWRQWSKNAKANSGMSSYVVHALISISVGEVTELLGRRWLSPVLWQPPASSLTQCAHLLNGPWEVLVHCLSCSSPSTCVEADIQRRLRVWEQFTLWPKLWNTASVAGVLGKHPLLSWVSALYMWELIYACQCDDSGMYAEYGTTLFPWILKYLEGQFPG